MYDVVDIHGSVKASFDSYSDAFDYSISLGDYDNCIYTVVS